MAVTAAFAGGPMRSLTSATLALLLLAAGLCPSQAQIRVTPTMQVHLVIEVVYENGRDRVPHATVELIVGGLSSFMNQKETNRDGRVEFQTITGKQRVRVTGPDILPYETEFEVEGTTRFLQRIVVRRRPDAAGAEAPPGAPVSVAALNIPEEAREAMEKGKQALDRKDMKSAKRHFQQAVDVYPTYAIAHNNLGVIFMQEGNLVEGRRAFERAIDADGALAMPYLNLARILDGERDFPRVEQLLTRYVALEPGNAEALFLLAKALTMTNKLEAALAAARRVHLQPHEEQARAHVLAARILSRQGDSDAAVSEYRLFLKEAPGDPMAQEARQFIQKAGQKGK
jgi:Flp pilus assembly protein TadD